jgi:hypothetical protein
VTSTITPPFATTAATAHGDVAFVSVPDHPRLPEVVVIGTLSTNAVFLLKVLGCLRCTNAARNEIPTVLTQVSITVVTEDANAPRAHGRILPAYTAA